MVLDNNALFSHNEFPVKRIIKNDNSKRLILKVIEDIK